MLESTFLESEIPSLRIGIATTLKTLVYANLKTKLHGISAGVGVRSPLLQHQHQQYDEQLRDIAASLTRPRSRRALPPPLERPTRLPPPDRLPVSTYCSINYPCATVICVKCFKIKNDTIVRKPQGLSLIYLALYHITAKVIKAKLQTFS